MGQKFTAKNFYGNNYIGVDSTSQLIPVKNYGSQTRYRL